MRIINNEFSDDFVKFGALVKRQLLVNFQSATTTLS